MLIVYIMWLTKNHYGGIIEVVKGLNRSRHATLLWSGSAITTMFVVMMNRK